MKRHSRERFLVAADRYEERGDLMAAVAARLRASLSQRRRPASGRLMFSARDRYGQNWEWTENTGGGRIGKRWAARWRLLSDGCRDHSRPWTDEPPPEVLELMRTAALQYTAAAFAALTGTDR